MKRGILLGFLVAVLVLGIYSVKEWIPIMPIAGNSMEPELSQGDAILIGQMPPSEVKVGDVIVFKIHPLIQKNYGYPAIVTHRVIEFTEFQGGLAFKTKGDNTTADPFVVPAYDLRGGVKARVPFLGYLLLFLQSRQGMLFAIVALTLLGLDLYAKDIRAGGKRLRRAAFAPVMEQQQELAQKQEQSAQMMSQALEQFSVAMKEYAQHLASHTTAVKELAAAAQELRQAAQVQNKQPRSLPAMPQPENPPEVSQRRN